MSEKAENVYPAHIYVQKDANWENVQIQTVTEHCRATAEYAAAALHAVHLQETGYLAGLVHDCGKFTHTFAAYIWEAAQGENVQRGTVNHTFAGCRLLLEHFHGEDVFRNLTCELLVYAVGAHHGLFDCIDELGKSGFLHRLEKQKIGYEESYIQFLQQCADWPELEKRFEAAHAELLPIYEKLQNVVMTSEEDGEQQLLFSVGQLARLLLSAVIEGDRRDTANFMGGCVTTQRGSANQAFWKPYLHYMEEKLRQFPQETEIQKARSKISDLCCTAALQAEGIYQLNVPTGGGKTLSALRYALTHAMQWGKQRILFVTPLLSILEQNAAVIRDFIGDDTIILEHHSNVLHTEENGEALDEQELVVENWNAPIILTTLVQFLNTLFLGKTTSIRRYQALCNAVVVIDEVQTVPNHMLSLFNAAVNFLATVCHTTFVLCSATQPCLDSAEHPLLPAEEIVPYQEKLWKPFHRTVLQDTDGMRLEEIPAFAKCALQNTDSLLIICNKKAESEFLYQSFSDGGYDCFHLSSAMCMAHRRDVLEQIEAALQKKSSSGRKVICVATQVMEAGVDISFGCVIRLAAGMDRVVQSAGRCNRNGECNSIAPVYIVPCIDEKLEHLREIQAGKQVTIALLHQYKQKPESFDSDLASNKAVEWYYHKLFREQCASKGYQQYPVKGHGTLFELMSSNQAHLDSSNPYFQHYTMNQALKTAGNLFHVLDDRTEDVVVPYGEGAELIAELSAQTSYLSLEWLRNWIQRTKPYTVSVYNYQKEMFMDGLVEMHGVLTLRPEYYNADTGLVTKPASAFLEV